MNPPATTIVVTTIQPPTPCMQALAREARGHGLHWLVIGDRKGPPAFDLAPAEFIPIDEQRQLPYRLARMLPEGHYARKNLGYLEAAARGSDRIYETDDDNGPIPGWTPRSLHVEALRLRADPVSPWVNIYAAFTAEHIWPRGLPIDRVRHRIDPDLLAGAEPVSVAAPIQQGLANGSPDVDAVWRLVLDHDVTFNDMPNLILPAGLWSPFNSQNTWWWRPVFPLLYLPSYCSFRMTDIWRSFVAQRCLWELGHELEFHRADVHQTRNEHNLLRDFGDETVGYLRNEEIRHLLEGLPLRPGYHRLKDNLHRCYEALVDASVVGRGEMALVEAWIEDVDWAAASGLQATDQRQ